jgi:hypothetical protein
MIDRSPISGGRWRIAVQAHQVVRDLDGNVISNAMIEHVYQIEDGLINSMGIREM